MTCASHYRPLFTTSARRWQTMSSAPFSSTHHDLTVRFLLAISLLATAMCCSLSVLLSPFLPSLDGVRPARRQAPCRERPCFFFSFYWYFFNCYLSPFFHLRPLVAYCCPSTTQALSFFLAVQRVFLFFRFLCAPCAPMNRTF